MKFCVVVGVPDVIIRANFGDDRFSSFWGSGGSNFPLFYWLALSSLKHSDTTVPACDICSFCTYFTLFLLDTLVWEGGDLFAYQISMRYLKSTPEIKLLPVSDDGRPPYWNFTSIFDFDLQCTCMCNYPHVISHPPAKFCSNRTNIGRILTSYRFLPRCM